MLSSRSPCHGLAALPIGYVLAPKELAGTLRMQGAGEAEGLGRLNIVAASAALRDTKQVGRTRTAVEYERARWLYLYANSNSHIPKRRRASSSLMWGGHSLSSPRGCVCVALISAALTRHSPTGIFRLNRVVEDKPIEVLCGHVDESEIPETYAEYEEKPREYGLSSINALVNVQTRIIDERFPIPIQIRGADQSQIGALAC